MPERLTPVYVSLAALESVIGDLARHGITGSVGAGELDDFSASMRRQIMAALKFLGLLDRSGRTRTALRALVVAYDTEAWPDALGAVLKRAYKPIFAAPLRDLDDAEFAALFARTYPSTPALTSKSVTFFISAARAARITLGSRLLRGRRVRRGRKATERQTPSSAVARRTEPEAAHRPVDEAGTDPALVPTRWLVDLLDQSVMTEAEQQALWTVIKFVKRQEDRLLAV